MSLASGVLMLGLLVLVGYLSYLQPLRADDIANLNVLRNHPDLVSFVRFWYEGWTGRVTGMALLWAGLQSKVLFSALNALAFGSLSVLTLALSEGRWPKADARHLAVGGFLLSGFWFSFPSISETVFWTTGATAYLWAAVLLLSAAVPFRFWLERDMAAGDEQRRPTTPLAAAGMLALGFAAGAVHEQVTVALFVAAASWLWAVRRHGALTRVPARLWTGIAGLCVGAGVQLLAPGNAVRDSLTPVASLTLAERTAAFAEYIQQAFGTWLAPVYPWMLAVGVAALVLGGARKRRGWFAAGTWLTCALASLAIFVAQPTIANLAGRRTTAFAGALLLVAAASLSAPRPSTGAESRRERLATAVAVVLLTLSVASALRGVGHAQALDAELNARKAYVQARAEAGQRDITVQPVTTPSTRIMLFVDITEDPTYWTNQAAAEYYGVSSIRIAEQKR